MTKAELIGDKFVTVNEVSDYLGVARSTLYRLMDSGELAYAKIGRSRRIPLAAARKLAADSLRGADSGAASST
jgi:excisionase family DNA binding protein